MTGIATRQNAVLDALKTGLCQTVEELSQATGLERRAVVQAAANLITRKLIAREERGCFAITGQGRAAQANGAPLTSGPNQPLTQRRPPRRKTFRQKVWSALRIRQKATVAEIMMVADGGTADNARRYLVDLEGFGYVRRLTRRVGGEYRWLIIQNTGPRAPRTRYGKAKLYDPNLGALIELPGKEAADAGG